MASAPCSPVQATLSLSQGQQQNINTGWQTDTSKFAYDFTVTVTAKGSTDGNPGNNSYAEWVGGIATVIMTNNSGRSVNEISFTPAGEPRTAHRECSVKNGQTKTFYVPPGAYDLWAGQEQFHEVVDERKNQQISGTYSWTMMPNSP